MGYILGHTNTNKESVWIFGLLEVLEERVTGLRSRQEGPLLVETPKEEYPGTHENWGLRVGNSRFGTSCGFHDLRFSGPLFSNIRVYCGRLVHTQTNPLTFVQTALTAS